MSQQLSAKILWGFFYVNHFTLCKLVHVLPCSTRYECLPCRGLLHSKVVRVYKNLFSGRDWIHWKHWIEMAQIKTAYSKNWLDLLMQVIVCKELFVINISNRLYILYGSKRCTTEYNWHLSCWSHDSCQSTLCNSSLRWTGRFNLMQQQIAQLFHVFIRIKWFYIFVYLK